MDGKHETIGRVPVPLKETGRFGVLCCGCRRMLGAMGEMLATTHGGLFPWGRMAVFESHAQADLYAGEHGWMVRDELGANHRCPECVAKAKEQQRAPEGGRGAYVEVPDGNGA